MNSCREESTQMMDCWYYKVEDQYQKSEYGEINFKRKLTKLQETFTYNSLLRLGTQVDVYQETKHKPLQW